MVDMTTQVSRHDMYNQLTSGLYDALVVTDANGHVIDWGKRASEYFQYTREQVWDKPISLLINGVTANMIGRIRKGLVESRHFILDARCCRQDGTTFSAEVTIALVDLLNSGDLIFSIRNTERRRRQWEALRSIANAFGNAQSACFVCDESGLFKAVNAAFVEMFDLPGEEAAVGRAFDMLMPDEPLPGLFAEALAGARVTHIIEAETGAETVARVEIRMVPDAHGDGRICGVVGSLLQI